MSNYKANAMKLKTDMTKMKHKMNQIRRTKSQTASVQEEFKRNIDTGFFQGRRSESQKIDPSQVRKLLSQAGSIKKGSNFSTLSSSKQQNYRTTPDHELQSLMKSLERS